MKKLLVGVAVGMVSFGAFAQGLVVMNTSATNQYLKFTNTTAANTFFYGPSQIYVGLYYASDAATLLAGGGTLATLGTTNTLGLAWLTPGTGGSAAVGGFVATTSGGGNRQILSQAGLDTYFQLRAWSQKDSQGNSLLSYAAALASGDPLVLVTHLDSPIDHGTLGTDASSLPFNPKWNPLSGAAGQAIAVGLYPVPEPATVALVGLGLLGLVFIRRRK